MLTVTRTQYGLHQDAFEKFRSERITNQIEVLCMRMYNHPRVVQLRPQAIAIQCSTSNLPTPRCMLACTNSPSSSRVHRLRKSKLEAKIVHRSPPRRDHLQWLFSRQSNRIGLSDSAHGASSVTRISHPYGTRGARQDATAENYQLLPISFSS